MAKVHTEKRRKGNTASMHTLELRNDFTDYDFICIVRYMHIVHVLVSKRLALSKLIC